MAEPFALPHTLGHYTLTRRLGAGGMGVVYLAHDDRLGRDVAVKMIAGLSDDSAIKRFWREARTAASVNHPHVCQIFEVDESPFGVYLAMELLDGEPLDARLGRGALPPVDAVRVATEMLLALSALQERGFVHRDIKPSNVFLTPHGAKLLDFGLAREISEATVLLADADAADVTMPGTVIGTPRYMAPEQVRAGPVDARTDVYAVGAVLFEMLAGRPAFAGDDFLQLAHAVVYEHAPALHGPPSVIAIDRVIRRAMAKDPAARFPTAAAMREDLTAIPRVDATSDAVLPVRALVRVMMPPLRLQRADDEITFLSAGLAESVSASLAALRDVVVRSPRLGGTAHGAEADVRALAVAADVDLLVLGSLLRMGDQLRVTVQLVEARSATVLGATNVKGAFSDVFDLEDRLSGAVAELLAPHRAASSGGEASTPAPHEAPVQGKAFEFFLRGIEHARELDTMRAARDWFQRALDEDPLFAPAWAWIGRCHRVIGKFEGDRHANVRLAEEAFRRALALAPDLPVAHRFLTHLEAEDGRADAAMARLLTHAKANRNDAQLFAALVHACRYAGLYAASMAAHEEARRLDPTVPTSHEYTLLMAGELERLRALRGDPRADLGAVSYVLVFDPTDTDGLAMLEALDTSRLPTAFRLTVDAVRGAFAAKTAGDRRGAAEQLDRALADHGAIQGDPEAQLLYALISARLEERERTLSLIESAVTGGFTPIEVLERTPLFAFVRDDPRFQSGLDTARHRRQVAAALFERNGGGTLLGLPPGTA